MDHRQQVVGGLKAALVAALCAFNAYASAAYTSLPTPRGFQLSPLTYGGSAVADYLWASQKVNGVMSGAMSGRGFALPFTAAAGSGAGAALATAMRAGAWGIAGIGAAWALGFGLEYIAGQWQKKQPAVGVAIIGCSAAGLFRACTGSAWADKFAGGNGGIYAETCGTAVGQQCRFYYHRLDGFADTSYGVDIVVKCSGGTIYSPASNSCVAAPYLPATEADWAPVTATPGSSIPDNVLNDARPYVAIPVDLPVASPLAIPLGEPYPTPSGWLQPQGWILPSPIVGDPFRVDEQPRELPVDGPSAGASAPYSPAASAPQGTVTPGTTGGQVEPPKSQCELTPNASGCLPLDVPDNSDTIPNDDKNVSITPDSGWGASNAACPASRSVTVQGHVIPIPYDLFCTYFGGLRYVIIAMAWLGAGFILLGAREGS